MSAQCSAWGCVIYNNNTQQDCKQDTYTFNSNANSYPTLISGSILKNTVTNEYYVYFEAKNSNGGICYLSYNAYSGTQQNIW